MALYCAATNKKKTVMFALDDRIFGWLAFEQNIAGTLRHNTNQYLISYIVVAFVCVCFCGQTAMLKFRFPFSTNFQLADGLDGVNMIHHVSAH